MPTISVLIAAYNAEGFLHRAVESAVGQTHPPLEVIIVDDASTDATLETARLLAQRHACVRIVALSENGGPAKARNAGLDVALGDWVAILDADDAFVANRLETLNRNMGATDVDIVADNFRFFDPASDWTSGPALVDERETFLIDRYNFVDHARPYNPQPDWGLLKPIFRREFLNTHNLRYPVESRHGEDFLFIVSALLLGARYQFFRNPGYLYTIRTSGMSRTRLNYQAQVDQSVALLSLAEVRGDARMQRLLRRRISAVRRLAVERRLDDIVSGGEPGQLARAFLNANMWRPLSKRALTKTRSAVRKWRSSRQVRPGSDVPTEEAEKRP
ncbi:glycosyltransferase family 2 protein [Caulobacter sp. S45]|uniref:glycosyltransferase family 2 protein n=1 Tax=Caulobacter sp. S45 TaxID=1641861 RepID=UPI00131DFB8C|nr:glycosyltransferase family 2 protein [Caulobacter sp. S45]